MKWFKHQSNARDDERVARLEDRAGLEGYGFYFKMLEIVAQMIDESDRCDVTFSLSRWGRQTNITSKKFLFLVQCCSDVGLMFVQRCDDDITVKIPNILKHRDNHTKNLQAASKQEEDIDIEKEVDKEEEENNTKTPADSGESSADENKKPKFTDADRELAIHMLASVQKISPSMKAAKSWPDDIRLMRERDNHTLDEIREMFDWANADPFWSANILSPGKLRDKWAQLEAQRNRPKLAVVNGKQSAHGGFEHIDYSKGVNADGSF